MRATDESAATYVAALRQIAEHSDYKDSLQDMLQDHLVCGVNDLIIQRWLLAEKDDTALDLAKSLEAAEKGSHDITVDNKFEPVHFNSQHQRPENPVCLQLRGGRGDMASICCFKDQDCHKCKKRGHTAKVCRSSQLTKISRKQTKNYFVNEDYTCICHSTTDVSEEQQEQEEDSYKQCSQQETAQQIAITTYCYYMSTK